MMKKVRVFPSYVVFNATDKTEYLSLTIANKALYQLVISQGYVDLADDQNAKSTLWSLFEEGTTTRENLENILLAREI